MLIVDEIVRLKEIVAARFVSTNPIDKSIISTRSPMAVQEFSNQRGVVWTAPTLSTKGPLRYERLANLYDLVKQIKQGMDPNNILNRARCID